MKAAIDNDVLYKGAWYGLLEELVSAIPSTPPETGALGQARFVIGRKLEKQKKDHGDAAGAALDRLNSMLASLATIEPTADEQALAAEFEHLAQIGGVALDGGESLLCAVVIRRGLGCLATGDKRAIAAMNELLPKHEELETLVGRVVCLEQLVARVAAADPVRVRKAVCAAKHADRSLANCFSCTNPEERPHDWADGLKSYIGSVRATAPTLIVVDT